MALSNILREPRREITETIVGIVIFAVFVYLDSLFAHWLNTFTVYNPCPIPLGYLLGVLVTIIVALLTVLIHAVGEKTCNALARNGLELRPKQRHR